MKKYVVWAKCGSCDHGEKIELEFEDTDSESFCDAECAEACNTLIGNEFDTGWDPVEEKDNELPEKTVR